MGFSARRVGDAGSQVIIQVVIVKDVQTQATETSDAHQAAIDGLPSMFTNLHSSKINYV